MAKLPSTIRDEFAADIRGVPGRFYNVVTWGAPVRDGKPVTLANQKWCSVGRPVKGYGTGARLTVEIRHDDNCKNGRESFAITGEVRVPGMRDIAAGGCLHDDIARVFPELAGLIKWHLCGIDGPMHYLANTIYAAGDRDCHGLAAGEVRQIIGRNNGKPCWKLATVDENGDEVERSALPQYVDAAECPPPPATLRYVPWVRVGKGKPRDLDAARRIAVWPEASDGDLCVAPEALREALLARLPALVADMRRDVEGCGFIWSGE